MLSLRATFVCCAAVLVPGTEAAPPLRRSRMRGLLVSISVSDLTHGRHHGQAVRTEGISMLSLSMLSHRSNDEHQAKHFNTIFGDGHGEPPTDSWFPKEWVSSLKDLTKHVNLHFLLMPVILGFALLVLMLSSIVDWVRRMRGERHGAGAPETKQVLKEWSKCRVVALTSFRFYTGFLSATWMPYLLAMEGHQLMGERQSIFMGSAKLIYGMTILLNPMFGLVGDKMAVVSHWSGRRLFVLVGTSTAGLGIYGCVVSSQLGTVPWYLGSTVLWMLGEAMADVTTETLVPELVPRSQHELASAIRALNFLLGGLIGYVALIIFRNFHYSWLYYGYIIVMLVCAFLTLSFIDAGDLVQRQETREADLHITSFFKQAYYVPSQIKGGFPKACYAMFVFSLGSAPMFFLLLMVRDVVGVRDHTQLQTHFSSISIVFFISAAISSVLGAVLASKKKKDESSPAEGGGSAEAAAAGSDAPQDAGSDEDRDAIRSRWFLMVMSTLGFAIVTTIIPFLGLLGTVASRKVAFYIFASAFGFGFGSVYVRFQECQWSLLPPDVNVANAMGYAAMLKLAGVGLGNFVVGFILDSFRNGSDAYSLAGYFVMCGFCCFVIFTAAYMAHTLGRQALADFDARKLTAAEG